MGIGASLFIGFIGLFPGLTAGGVLLALLLILSGVQTNSIGASDLREFVSVHNRRVTVLCIVATGLFSAVICTVVSAIDTRCEINDIICGVFTFGQGAWNWPFLIGNILGFISACINQCVFTTCSSCGAFLATRESGRDLERQTWSVRDTTREFDIRDQWGRKTGTIQANVKEPTVKKQFRVHRVCRYCGTRSEGRETTTR